IRRCCLADKGCGLRRPAVQFREPGPAPAARLSPPRRCAPRGRTHRPARRAPAVPEQEGLSTRPTARLARAVRVHRRCAPTRWTLRRGTTPLSLAPWGGQRRRRPAASAAPPEALVGSRPCLDELRPAIYLQPRANKDYRASARTSSLALPAAAPGRTLQAR